MNKESIIKAFNKTKYKIGKYAPEILIGIGITEMAMTVALAVKATPKAVKLIDEAKAKKAEETIEYNCKQNKVTDCVSSELTPLETIKVAWKPYIPAAITGAVAVACIIGSNSINSKRNAAIATAYKISEAALNDYKAKVVESIGEKKEQIIQEKVAQDKIDSNPPTNTTVIMAGNGDQLFYDGVSGRYFNSTIEKVDAAINTINRTMPGKPIAVYCEDFLTDKKHGNFDTVGVFYALKTENGKQEKIEINRFFRAPEGYEEGNLTEISKEEYEERKARKISGGK